jgi:hypothetical protein
VARIIPEAAVGDAIAEFQSKTERDIERETAIRWGARALAAYLLYEDNRKRDWLLLGDDYYHEAVEHGALVFDHGETARQIQLQIEPVRKRMLKLGSR